MRTALLVLCRGAGTEAIGAGANGVCTRWCALACGKVRALVEVGLNRLEVIVGATDAHTSAR